MTYPELRKRLRTEGFINDEIGAIHIQYLCMRAMGIEDNEMVFDRDHGLLVTKDAKDKYKQMMVAPDTEYHCAYIIHDDGSKTRVGPFT